MDLFLATQAAAARFPQGGGRIINVSSVMATHAIAGLPVYSATKSALDALTRVWAAELGAKGMTVNAVAPGPADTDIMRGSVLGADAISGMIARTPLGRLGAPSDIADVFAFLLIGRALGDRASGRDVGRHQPLIK